MKLGLIVEAPTSTYKPILATNKPIEFEKWLDEFQDFKKIINKI